MADPISTIEDVANLRAIPAAVAANPGSIAIENVAGTLKQVDDQGVATALGGSAAAITSLTGAVTATGPGSAAASIAANAVTTAKILDANVTLAKIANIADQTVLGNNAGAPGRPIALTKAQMQTLLGTCLYDLVPAADMNDADQTVQPAQLAASLFTIPATVTGSHIYTFGNTSATALRESWYVVNKSSFSQTIKNAAGTTLGVLPAASGNVFYALNGFFLTNQILNVSFFFKSP